MRSLIMDFPNDRAVIPYESNIPVKYNGANRQLLIDDRKVSFGRMIKNRVFEVTWVTKKTEIPAFLK